MARDRHRNRGAFGKKNKDDYGAGYAKAVSDFREMTKGVFSIVWCAACDSFAIDEHTLPDGTWASKDFRLAAFKGAEPGKRGVVVLCSNHQLTEDSNIEFVPSDDPVLTLAVKMGASTGLSPFVALRSLKDLAKSGLITDTEAAEPEAADAEAAEPEAADAEAAEP